MSLIDSLISTLAPYDCLGCGREGSLLCTACAIKLPPALPLPEHASILTSVRAVTTYTGVAKDLAWKLKSAGAQAAAHVMAIQMLALLEADKDMVIVPIPTATGRVRQRGYDQARLLARALAAQAGLPWIDCLARIGQTHQVGANRQQRLGQLQTAFRVSRPGVVRNAHLLLVDDVATTGATLEMAAQALLAAGANRVDALTFAQA